LRARKLEGDTNKRIAAVVFVLYIILIQNNINSIIKINIKYGGLIYKHINVLEETLEKIRV
jgi:hypothetical protein